MFAKSNDVSTIIFINPNQWYFDPAIVTDGLEQAGTGWDYFTQFEHCRLPVGMGCRALSLQNDEIRSWTQGPEELVAHILANPLKFICRYDARPLTDFETSLAESRYQAGHPFFEEMPTSPSLESFKARATKVAPPKYEASTESAFVDERLMPAGFGFESKECADFPTYVMFDVTNVCNAKCVHCPHSTVFPEKRGAKRHLPLEYFKQVVNECTDKPLNFVRITADGEPLLHPDIIEMLNYCGAKNVGPVGLTTNGSLMTEEMAQKVIDSGIFMVDFSLDAATEETYKNIRVGLSFKKTYENVNRFIELAREQRPEMKVMVSYVKQEGNLHEVDAFREYWEPKVNKVLVRELISNVNLVDTPRADAEIQRRWPCPHFFRRIVINYDGVLKACPIDWENKTSYRSLGETSIFDAWHSEYYHRARMEHLNLAFKTVTACGDCADWAGSPWELGYEKVVNTL
ncbi:radical SAM/SPASM domain-containing protein [Pseudodesulfovibrio cashew]|nr:radical SAM protein [Pseudodesulfovibrio cashew]